MSAFAIPGDIKKMSTTGAPISIFIPDFGVSPTKLTAEAGNVLRLQEFTSDQAFPVMQAHHRDAF